MAAALLRRETILNNHTHSPDRSAVIALRESLDEAQWRAGRSMLFATLVFAAILQALKPL